MVILTVHMGVHRVWKDAGIFAAARHQCQESSLERPERAQGTGDQSHTRVGRADSASSPAAGQGLAPSMLPAYSGCCCGRRGIQQGAAGSS